jgi:hypothetical protein
MPAAVARVLAPVHPDAEAGFSDRIAAAGLEFRALWLRMPPWTLAFHGTSKFVRSFRGSPTKSPAP